MSNTNRLNARRDSVSSFWSVSDQEALQRESSIDEILARVKASSVRLDKIRAKEIERRKTAQEHQAALHAAMNKLAASLASDPHFEEDNVDDDGLAGGRKLLLEMVGGSLEHMPKEIADLVKPITLFEAGGSAARLARMIKERAHMIEVMTARFEERRQRWLHRFMVVGDFWHRKLRFCNFRQSLRSAFEDSPALEGNNENRFMVNRLRFLAACNASIVINDKLMDPAEFDDFFERAFDMFDIEVRGSIDYREFVATLLFFRIPPEADPRSVMDSIYRHYLADGDKGLTVPDFFRVLIFLAESTEEARRLLRCCNWNALVEAHDKQEEKERQEQEEIAKGNLLPEQRALSQALDAKLKEEEEAARVVEETLAGAALNAVRGKQSSNTYDGHDEDDPANLSAMLESEQKKIQYMIQHFAKLNDVDINPYAKYKSYSQRRIFLVPLLPGEADARLQAQYLMDLKQASNVPDLVLEKVVSKKRRRDKKKNYDDLATVLELLNEDEEDDIYYDSEEEDESYNMMDDSLLQGVEIDEEEARIRASWHDTYGWDRVYPSPATYLLRGKSLRKAGQYTGVAYIDYAWAPDGLDLAEYRAARRYNKQLVAEAKDAAWTRGRGSLSVSRFYGSKSALKGTYNVEVERHLGIMTGRFKRTLIQLQRVDPWLSALHKSVRKLSDLPSHLRKIPVPVVVHKYGLPNPLESEFEEMESIELTELLIKQLEAEDILREKEMVEMELRDERKARPSTQELEEEVKDEILPEFIDRIPKEREMPEIVPIQIGPFKFLVNQTKQTHPRTHITLGSVPGTVTQDWMLREEVIRPEKDIRNILGDLKLPLQTKASFIPSNSALAQRQMQQRQLQMQQEEKRVAELKQKALEEAKPVKRYYLEVVPPDPRLRTFGKGIQRKSIVSSNPMFSSTSLNAVKKKPQESSIKEQSSIASVQSQEQKSTGQENVVVDPVTGRALVLGAPPEGERPNPMALTHVWNYKPDIRILSTLNNNNGSGLLPPHIRIVTLPMMHAMLQQSPGLLLELHRLRLLRLPQGPRVLYLASQLKAQIKRETEAFDELREESQLSIAIKAHDVMLAAKVFQAWKTVARELIWERVKINSLRVRRACRSWALFAVQRRVTRAKNALAETWHYQVFMRRYFRAWSKISKVQGMAFNAMSTRAVNLYESTLKMKCFQALAIRAKYMRAARHYVAVLLHRSFHNWARAVAIARAQRLQQTMVETLRHTKLLETNKVFEMALDEYERETRAKEEEEAYAEFEQQVFHAALEDFQKQEALEAEKKAKREKILEMQRQARRINFKKERERFDAEFEATWQEKIQTGVELAKKRALEWCLSEEGHGLTLTNAKQIVDARVAEFVTQPGSVFQTDLHPVTYRVRYTCEPDPEDISPLFPNGRPYIQYVVGEMSIEDGIKVATCHHIASVMIDARAMLLVEKEKTYKAMIEEMAATKIQRYWRGNKFWHLTLDTLRMNFELCVDPCSGERYYLDLRSFTTTSKPPALFRSVPVHPIPDYWARWDASTQAYEYVDSYDHSKVFKHPIDGYLYCTSCSVQFATRFCSANGCQNMYYCFQCFSYYHPIENEEWRSHWNSAQRVQVKSIKNQPELVSMFVSRPPPLLIQQDSIEAN